MTRKSEKYVGEILARVLKKNYGSNFSVEENECKSSEEQEIDIFLRKEEEKYNVQVVSIEPPGHRRIVHNKKYDKERKGHSILWDPLVELFQTGSKKEAHYPSEVKTHTILVIDDFKRTLQGREIEIPNSRNTGWKMFKKGIVEKSDFLGIFVVINNRNNRTDAPGTMSTGYYGEYVMAIKNPFGEDLQCLYEED